MYQLDKKPKIILGILVAIVAGFICYYVYAKEDNSTQLEIENNATEQEEIEQQNEGYSDDTILVHISGAVNKEEVVELKANSRISDAIDKVRRIKRRCQYRRYQFGV